MIYMSKIDDFNDGYEEMDGSCAIEGILEPIEQSEESINRVKEFERVIKESEDPISEIFSY